jgi:hypothetical protein
MRPGTLYSRPQKRATQISPAYLTGENKMLIVLGEKRKVKDKDKRTPKTCAPCKERENKLENFINSLALKLYRKFARLSSINFNFSP